VDGLAEKAAHREGEAEGGGAGVDELVCAGRRMDGRMFEAEYGLVATYHEPCCGHCATLGLIEASVPAL